MDIYVYPYMYKKKLRGVGIYHQSFCSPYSTEVVTMCAFL